MNSEEQQTSLPNYLILVPGYEMFQTSDGPFVIRGKERFFVFRGKIAPIAARLLSIMDGTRTPENLAQILKVDLKIVIQILEKMWKSHLLSDRTHLLSLDNPFYGSATFVQRFDTAALMGEKKEEDHSFFQKLQDKQVVVVASTDLGKIIENHLLQLGVGKVVVVHFGEVRDTLLTELQPALLIYGSSELDYQETTKINLLALRHSQPWLAGWRDDFKLYVSHVFIPSENACFECFIQRKRANYVDLEIEMGYETYLRSGRKDVISFPKDSNRVQHDLLSTILTLRAIKYLSGRKPNLPVPTLLEFSILDLQITNHPVLRLPYCPKCSTTNIQPATQSFITNLQDQE